MSCLDITRDANEENIGHRIVRTTQSGWRTAYLEEAIDRTPGLETVVKFAEMKPVLNSGPTQGLQLNYMFGVGTSDVAGMKGYSGQYRGGCSWNAAEG